VCGICHWVFVPRSYSWAVLLGAPGVLGVAWSGQGVPGGVCSWNGARGCRFVCHGSCSLVVCWCECFRVRPRWFVGSWRAGKSKHCAAPCPAGMAASGDGMWLPCGLSCSSMGEEGESFCPGGLPWCMPRCPALALCARSSLSPELWGGPGRGVCRMPDMWSSSDVHSVWLTSF
jgi:hypothetical protein